MWHLVAWQNTDTAPCVGIKTPPTGWEQPVTLEVLQGSSSGDHLFSLVTVLQLQHSHTPVLINTDGGAIIQNELLLIFSFGSAADVNSHIQRSITEGERLVRAWGRAFDSKICSPMVLVKTGSAAHLWTNLSVVKLTCRGETCQQAQPAAGPKALIFSEIFLSKKRANIITDL